MKTKLSLLSLAVCAVFSTGAFAQSGTINFTGTIQSASCTADINGGGAGTGIVNLGTTAPATVDAVGAVANHTTIDVTLDASCVGDNFWVYFSGGNVNTDGRLNTPVNGIHVQLTSGNTANPIVVGQTGSYNAAMQGLAPGAGQGNSWTVANGVGTITGAYGAQFYSAVAGPNKTGSIAGTSVTYNVIYF